MREMFLTSCLEWRLVMSWYTVDGTAYTMIDIAQSESWSSSVIARGSAQSEPWDLGYYWPWWRWDPGGLLVGWYHERSVWDPGIERSLHIRMMQSTGEIQWRIRDPGIFCSIGGEHPLGGDLLRKLLEGKQHFAGGDCNIPNLRQQIGIFYFVYFATHSL